MCIALVKRNCPARQFRMSWNSNRRLAKKAFATAEEGRWRSSGGGLDEVARREVSHIYSREYGMHGDSAGRQCQRIRLVKTCCEWRNGPQMTRHMKPKCLDLPAEQGPQHIPSHSAQPNLQENAHYAHSIESLNPGLSPDSFSYGVCIASCSVPMCGNGHYSSRCIGLRSPHSGAR